jgi:dUTP pyrophosphatase
MEKIIMEKIAKFEKVSFEQFKNDWLKNYPDTEDVKAIYDAIKLPKRATVGSAGYDFYAPANIKIEKGKSTLIPTGIRSRINDGWVLNIFPRSGLGFKHRVQLDNTVGVIDADYYNSSNEGHIMVKLSCTAHDDGHLVEVNAGEGFAQGIFLQFGITTDDDADGVRDGGFGSTTK